MDSRCYHMGENLGRDDGTIDVVEIEDAAAVRCPAHGRMISTTGHAVVRNATLADWSEEDIECERGMRGVTACSWRLAPEQKQRTHQVWFDDDGRVHLRLSDTRGSHDGIGTLPSDAFNIPAIAAPSASSTASPPPSSQHLAFACRKRRATDAVRIKWSAASSDSLASSPFSYASPLSSSSASQRQDEGPPATARLTAAASPLSSWRRLSYEAPTWAPSEPPPAGVAPAGVAHGVAHDDDAMDVSDGR